MSLSAWSIVMIRVYLSRDFMVNNDLADNFLLSLFLKLFHRYETLVGSVLHVTTWE